MKVPYSWLREYTSVKTAPKSLAKTLTNLGLEVSEISFYVPPFENVVAARVEDIRESGATLKTVSVYDGSRRYEVVCGAPNLKKGMISALARPGALLKETRVDIKAFGSKKSEGMLCSEKELSVGQDSSGIMQLPSAIKPGTDLRKAFGSEDPVFEIELTPNRPDCLSIIGIAREVAAYYGLPLRMPRVDFRKNRREGKMTFKVSLEDPKRCKRYSGMLLKGVSVQPSPFWLKCRLYQMGLVPVNNIVDITNYVLFELGQPLHAFDLSKISGHRIIINGSSPGETIHALDSKEYNLTGKELVIRDSSGPVALAGIIGGSRSAIGDDTEDIFLECAFFDPLAIRRTSRNLGLSTDSSYRFERGTDILNIPFAVKRTAALMTSCAGGYVSGDMIDRFPSKPKRVTVRFSPEKTNNLLGTRIPSASMGKIIRSLGMSLSDKKISVPSFRSDISRQADITEEIARHYGYDNIPVCLPVISFCNLKKVPRKIFSKKIHSIMGSLGFFETINTPFLNQTTIDLFSLEKSVEIKNPLVLEERFMRSSLIPGLLLTASSNIKKGNKDIKFYELGNIFTQGGRESFFISGICSGKKSPIWWKEKQEETDIFYTKGVIHLILKNIGLEGYEEDHSGGSVKITLKGYKIAEYGEVNPEITAELGIKQRTYFFDLDLDRIISNNGKPIKYEQVPRYPYIERDLAFTVPLNLTEKSLNDRIKNRGTEYLESITLFDNYSGPPVKDGHKSIAYRLRFQARDRTLTDQEVDIIIKDILGTISDDLKVEIRER